MITVRPARVEDAEFIAHGLLTALWKSGDEMERLLPACIDVARMDNTLYSWRNACIAQWDGADAAVLISYDGASYREAAHATFEYIKKLTGEDYTAMTDEAEAGEWYIDTLAVLPEYRRKGLAQALLLKGIELCRECPDTSNATLYVDPEHPWVVKLYEKVGFRPDGEAFIFGQKFMKMVV